MPPRKPKRLSKPKSEKRPSKPKPEQRSSRTLPKALSEVFNVNNNNYKVMTTAQDGNCSFDTINYAQGGTATLESLRKNFAELYTTADFHQGKVNNLRNEIKEALGEHFEDKPIPDLLQKIDKNEYVYLLSTEDIEKLGRAWKFAPIFINKWYKNRTHMTKEQLIFGSHRTKELIDYKFPIILIYTRSHPDIMHYEPIVCTKEDKVVTQHRFEDLPSEIQNAVNETAETLKKPDDSDSSGSETEEEERYQHHRSQHRFEDLPNEIQNAVNETAETLKKPDDSDSSGSETEEQERYDVDDLSRLFRNKSESENQIGGEGVSAEGDNNSGDDSGEEGNDSGEEEDDSGEEEDYSEEEEDYSEEEEDSGDEEEDDSEEEEDDSEEDEDFRGGRGGIRKRKR